MAQIHPSLQKLIFSKLFSSFQVNIFTQGKFRKMGEFEIQDNEQRRRYKGKFFLFEKCSVYAETIEDNGSSLLEYRGHYQHTKFGMVWREGKSKFRLFERRSGHKEIELHSDIVTVNEWAGIIQEILMKYVAEEKEKLKKAATGGSRRSNAASVRSSTVSSRSYRASTASTASTESK